MHSLETASKPVKNTENPLVSIIIPAFNEEDNIEKTLSSILNLNYPDKYIEIIVVDNGSSDNTFQEAKQFTENVFILESGNVGAVRNYGAQQSNGEILCFIDADCMVPKNWLNTALKIINSQKVIAGGKYKSRSDANWIERYWLLENPEHAKIQKDLLGGCIVVKRDNFFSVNGFNEKMTSGEDTDLSKRFRSAGYKIEIRDELSVLHLGNPNTIKVFMKRQIWHSENYLQFPKDSIKDPTFILCAAFLTLIIVSFTEIILGNIKESLITGLMALLIPSIFSAKRIIYSRFPINSIKAAIKIYALDLTYVIGRSAGIIKSAIKVF